MNEINYEMKLKLTMTHESWAMNILCAVFVTENLLEKNSFKKIRQRNSKPKFKFY